MTVVAKDDVFEVVRKHLTQIVEEIPESAVVREASMKELGASSLDIVEVVSCSMRELRVRIPRDQLAELKDIGGLVDLLHDTLEQKRA